jgi:hypothetical protein
VWARVAPVTVDTTRYRGRRAWPTLAKKIDERRLCSQHHLDRVHHNVTPLTGLGIWIWQLSACEGGDVNAIAAKAVASGVSWVAIKAGDGTANGQVTLARVQALRAAGIECAAWWYSTPSTTATELAMITDLVQNQGLLHLIQDAEIEWETVPGPNNTRVSHDFSAQAAAFATQVRNAVGADTFIADAPWARPKSHGGTFPYTQFGAMVNARFPQFYWEVAEVAGLAQAPFLAQCDAQWLALDPNAVVCPGSTVNQSGAVHCPIAELGVFLDRYAGRQACSLWSWQHLDAAEWALLAQRAATPPSGPVS